MVLLGAMEENADCIAKWPIDAARNGAIADVYRPNERVLCPRDENRSFDVVRFIQTQNMRLTRILSVFCAHIYYASVVCLRLWAWLDPKVGSGSGLLAFGSSEPSYVFPGRPTADAEAISQA